MKSLEKILAEISDLQQQAADILVAISGVQKEHGIWCRNCKFYDAYCQRRRHFPACFQPDEGWREKYEESEEK